MPITGYYDGSAVRTDAQFEMNQRVLIVPISDDFFDEGTAAGMLHKYANPDLIPSEKDAWRKAAVEKHKKA